MTALTLAAAPIRTPRLPPMLHALRWLAGDLFSTLAFVGLYATTHSPWVATLTAVAVGILQLAYERLRRRAVDAMQIASLALVAVFGAASLLTHDARFIMMKPTLVYAVIGAVMLRRGWMNRYVPEVALRWSGDLVTRFGYGWAGLMFVTAALNAGLALAGRPAIWGGVITLFPLLSKAALMMVQYGVTRAITVRRVHQAARSG
jgi:intracellular septation protein